jgi:hypothetical protein
MKLSHAAQDAVLVLDTALVALGINSLAKIGARRQRPCFHYGLQNESEVGLLSQAGQAHEEFLSFFSGDATIAFVTYSAGVCLAHLRGRSYASSSHPLAVKGVSPLAVVGGFFAWLGALLRVVAFMHWMTDVLMGVLVGSICGCLPLLLFSSTAGGSGGGDEQAHENLSHVLAPDGNPIANGPDSCTGIGEGELASNPSSWKDMSAKQPERVSVCDLK